ncbi:MAG: LEA type 2 family protein [Myxococcaceae bacterium]
MRRLVWLIPLFLSLSGCAALSKLFKSAFRQPELVFKSAQLQDANLGSATVNLIYELRNPNAFGLNLAELSYNFEVEGKQVVAGTPPNGLQIKPNGSTQLTFPANVKSQDIAPVVETFLTKDFANYKAEGHIGIKTPIGIIRLPISKEGQFEVPKVPAVAFGQPRIANLSFTSAQLEFPVTVTNRNTYVLPINQVSGGLLIAGANVGSLATGNLGGLDGKAAKQITLPVTVNFASALSAANAIRQGNANIAWNGAVQSGSVSIPIKLSQNLAFRK